MSGRWFRKYENTMDNPKVQMLSDWHYRAWDTLLCFASKSRGEFTDDIKVLSFVLRKPAGKTRDTIQALLSAGLIDKTEGGYIPHEWREYQYISDVSNERVKKYRERTKASGAKVNGYLVHRDTVTERDNGRCIYCGSSENIVIDHVVPIINGGPSDPWNLATACKSCNSGKSGRDPFQAGLKFRGKEFEAFCRRAVDTVTRNYVTVTVTPPEYRDRVQNTDTEKETISLVPYEGTPPFIAIPTNRFETNGEEVGVSESQIEEFQKLFPAVDVRQELRAMRAWCITNTDRRKTKRGVMRFVSSWLSRQQDKGKSNGHRNGKGASNDGFLSGVAAYIGDRLGPPEGENDSSPFGETGGPLLPGELHRRAG